MKIFKKLQVSIDFSTKLLINLLSFENLIKLSTLLEKLAKNSMKIVKKSVNFSLIFYKIFENFAVIIIIIIEYAICASILSIFQTSYLQLARCHHCPNCGAITTRSRSFLRYMFFLPQGQHIFSSAHEQEFEEFAYEHIRFLFVISLHRHNSPNCFVLSLSSIMYIIVHMQNDQQFDAR